MKIRILLVLLMSDIVSAFSNRISLLARNALIAELAKYNHLSTIVDTLGTVNTVSSVSTVSTVSTINLTEIYNIDHEYDWDNFIK